MFFSVMVQPSFSCSYFLFYPKVTGKTICCLHSSALFLLCRKAKFFTDMLRTAILIERGGTVVYDTLIRAVETYFDEIKVLKRGARGTVTLVRHRDTGKRYIFRCFDGSDEVYRRLLTVDCPYLPRIEEAAESRGRVAVLEEYVQGDTLLYLLEGGVLDWSEARKVTADICGALWVLHSMGAVHRDVKESNVILRGGDAVLIDFDASRIVKPEHPADTVILGTTGYAAPEQFGMSQTDGRADIYSLGVLLNVMLTGQHPSRRLAEGRAGRIVRRCTMMNPDQRFHDVLELRDAL